MLESKNTVSANQKFYILASNSSRPFVLTDQCCQVCDFLVELGYFNTVATGCFSCPRVKATPITWYLAPAMQILPGEPHQKNMYFITRNAIFTGDPPRNAVGLVLG